MSIFKIVLLSLIQGVAELLPISSSAHVIVAEKWMGLDPSTPEMTFLLVMLHTGTMFSVLFYFWPRWRKLKMDFLKMIVIATAFTGVVGLLLKKLIEKVILESFLGESQGEIEQLFKSLPLISASLLLVGLLIFFSGLKDKKGAKKALSSKMSILVGIVQGLCLPFRGFSRSGSTISTAILGGVPRQLAEDFSFALAVVLTPPIIFLEFHRLLKASGADGFVGAEVSQLVLPGLMGMFFSFIAGLFALRWLSAWLEQGKWKYFGVYCILASGVIFGSSFF